MCRALEIDRTDNVSGQVMSEFGIPLLKRGMVSRPDGSSIQANFITEQQLYFVKKMQHLLTKPVKLKKNQLDIIFPIDRWAGLTYN